MLEKRRAFIEFLSKKSIRITTPFRQRTFTLDSDCFIDLISLKMIGKRSNLYIQFSYDDEDDSYVGEVVCLINKGKNDIIDKIEWPTKDLEIRTTVWVDD